jgi:8-oxo-dGTP pyrophosphatase MutT (NUDIX family)
MSAHGGREAGSVQNPGERAVDDTRPTSKVTSCGYIVLDPQEFQGPWLMAIPYRGSPVRWQVDNFKGKQRFGESDHQTAERELLEEARLCLREHCILIPGAPYEQPIYTYRDRQRVQVQKKVVLFLCYLKKPVFRQQLVVGREHGGIWWEDLRRLVRGECAGYPAWMRDQAGFVLTSMTRFVKDRLYAEAPPVPRDGAARLARCVVCLASSASIAALHAGAQKSCHLVFCQFCVRSTFRDSYAAVLHRYPACPVCRSVVQEYLLVYGLPDDA